VTIAEEPDPTAAKPRARHRWRRSWWCRTTSSRLAIARRGRSPPRREADRMRIDIKSESEVEASAAEAEHAEAPARRCHVARGDAGGVPGARRDGLVSPRAVVAAGRERLAALPAVGAAADTILAAAEAWVAEREPRTRTRTRALWRSRSTRRAGVTMMKRRAPIRTCLGCRAGGRRPRCGGSCAPRTSRQRRRARPAAAPTCVAARSVWSARSSPGGCARVPAASEAERELIETVVPER